MPEWAFILLQGLIGALKKILFGQVWQRRLEARDAWKTPGRRPLKQNQLTVSPSSWRGSLVLWSPSACGQVKMPHPKYPIPWKAPMGRRDEVFGTNVTELTLRISLREDYLRVRWVFLGFILLCGPIGSYSWRSFLWQFGFQLLLG